MKVYSFTMILTLCVAASSAFITGCTYDVAGPLWDKPPASSTSPTINSIEPAQATPGVNIITIRGTNFTGALDTSVVHNDYIDTSIAYNGVYFDILRADIIDFSATSIKVRRPNLTTDSCTVKVAPRQALIAARFGPYRIDAVLERYGSFLDNVELSVLAADNAENLYVARTGDRNILKVTPTGETSVLGTASRAPWDASIGPDGRLYMPGNNRSIDVMDVTTGAVARWTQLPSGKVVRYGDFDADGYFYTGGARTDLVVVAPNLATTNSGFYPTAEILAVRVSSGYVYVVAKNPTGQTPSVGIWRHSIAAGGVLGQKELVLDWDGTGDFASRTIEAIALATNGTIFIATDAVNPVLIFDPATQALDYFYKGIIPPYCKHFCWGSQTYTYLISGNSGDPAQEWTVYRVDMGATGIP